MTAAHPKFRCTVCKSIDREFQLLASSYAAERNGKKTSQTDVFFVRLDYGSAQKVFQSYQLTSVPLIFHVEPRFSDKSSSSPTIDYQISTKDKFFPSSTEADAESIASFVRDKTSVSVTIHRSMLMSYVIIVVVFGILLALVQPTISALPFILKLIRLRYIWLIISCAVYTVSISGMIFDVIRSPQMYYANPQSGQLVFFHPQSGNQFVVEGFIIGFLNVAAAGGLLLAAVMAPKFKAQNTKDYSLVAGVVIFTVCFFQIRSLYKMKNRWYGMSG